MSVIETKLSERELERLAAARELRWLQEQMLDPKRLAFYRWLYEKGRIYG